MVVVDRCQLLPVRDLTVVDNDDHHRSDRRSSPITSPVICPTGYFPTSTECVREECDISCRLSCTLLLLRDREYERAF